MSFFKNCPFNPSLIHKIKASFSLVNISDTLPAGGCSAQALKPEMAGRWLFHYPARASDQEQSSQPGVKTGNDKLEDTQTVAHLFRCPVHPRYSRRRRTVSWAGDWTASVVGKSLKCLEKLYTSYDKICKISSVFEEITNLSGECGPLTWYDGGSYINLGPCALLRQQRSEKFKYGKKDEICFNNDRQPGECRTQLRIQIKETENIIVSGSTRVWKCFHPNLKSWGWEIFSIFAK